VKERPRHFVVVDLEATCSKDDAIPRTEMEIIEIGAVMVHGQNLNALDEFQTFIKPVRHPTLTDFCTELTTIAQSQVEEAPPFNEAFDEFQLWLTPFEDAVLSSWGAYDRNQIKQDCVFHRVRFPFGKRHLNIKQAFAQKVGLKRGLGMKAALDMAELPLLGTHHRGIDDARNIAALLPWAMGQKPIRPEKMPTRKGKKGPG
jgi:inhibitor of KinA sporulation pathway (predicted exonuclease)